MATLIKSDVFNAPFHILAYMSMGEEGKARALSNEITGNHIIRFAAATQGYLHEYELLLDLANYVSKGGELALLPYVIHNEEEMERQ